MTVLNGLALDGLTIGISACMMHADKSRIVFNGRPLSYIEASMADWLFRSGATPVMLPYTKHAEQCQRLVAAVDGLLLHGGVDLAPESYGETPLRPEWSGDPVRDQFEIELVKQALAIQQPILGICRGHQLLNVALGGSLYQDIQTQVTGSLMHRSAQLYDKVSHDVEILPNTLLSQLYANQMQGKINSVHHQAIKTLAPGFAIEAISPLDDIIEAIRITTGPYADQFVLGIQWHPEFQDPQDMSTQHLLSPMPILQAFGQAIRARTLKGSNTHA